MRTLLLLLGLAVPAAADVLLLKDGQKIPGRVEEKEKHYVVTFEGEQKTFLKDEVERWCRSPRDLLGEATQWIEEAKKVYLQAVAMEDLSAAGRLLHGVLPRALKAREAYAEARDLFPDGHADLDEALLNVMRLLRLIRERIGSELASEDKPSPLPSVVTPPAPPDPKADPLPNLLAETLALVSSPERRARAADRETARGELLEEASDPRFPPLATALAHFLRADDHAWGLVHDQVTVKAASTEQIFTGRLQKVDDTSWILRSAGRDVKIRRTASEWIVSPAGLAEIRGGQVTLKEGVRGPGFDPFQKYITQPDLATLSAAGHATAAASLVAADLALRKQNPTTPCEVLRLFAAAHLDALLADSPTSAKAAAGLAATAGWRRVEDAWVVGPPEGLAARTYLRWLRARMSDLAIVEFHSLYKGRSDFETRYILGILYMYASLDTNRDYPRAYLHFEKMAQTAPTPLARDHLQAMAKSIRAVAVCRPCGGTHQVRCTICFGKLKADFQCTACGGSGRFVRGFGGGERPCRSCEGKGSFKDMDCLKCRKGTAEPTGMIECKAKGCTKAVPRPSVDAVCDATPCAFCDGRGVLFERVAIPCPDCGGVGYLFAPRADPAKTLR